MSFIGEKGRMVGKDLLKRTISAILMGAIVVLAIWSGGVLFQGLVSLCIVLMLYEWVCINRNRLSVLFVCGCIYIISPMLFWLYEARYFPDSLQVNISWIFMIVCSCDIGAYFGGSFIGGAKLAPSISPNKTWSGTISGAVLAFVLSYAYICMFMWSDRRLVIASGFIIIAAVVGDLIESKVKRILNVKDTGRLLPGHGGVCDRLDSFILATYVFMVVRYIIIK
jgi:phosphatidate cytidylyltransferase